MKHSSVGAWSAAWRSLALREPPGLLHNLLARYQEPHRSYHNLRHIEECFDSLSAATHLAMRLDEVHLALWFHDAVFDPRAGDNEIASADLARRSLGVAGADDAAVDRIVSSILATRHDIPAEETDSQLVADVDLTILAAPRDRFDEYQRQIREEYSFMPQAEFQRRRIQILRGFLTRPAIYQTDWFRARFEQAARDNVAGELAAVNRPETR